MKLILLPGMDGTGDLFQDFLQRMPQSVEAQVVSYPRDQVLSYDDLIEFVRSRLPNDGTLYWIMAESFSGPIAVRLCAENPVGLKGIILVASFLKSPLPRNLHFLARPLLFRIPLAKLLIKNILLDRQTPDEVVIRTREAIKSVKPEVLAARAKEILLCDVEKEYRASRLPIVYIEAGNNRVVKNQKRYMVQQGKFFFATTLAGPHLLVQRHPQLVLDEVLRSILRT